MFEDSDPKKNQEWKDWYYIVKAISGQWNGWRRWKYYTYETVRKIEKTDQDKTSEKEGKIIKGAKKKGSIK